MACNVRCQSLLLHLSLSLPFLDISFLQNQRKGTLLCDFLYLQTGALFERGRDNLAPIETIRWEKKRHEQKNGERRGETERQREREKEKERKRNGEKQQQKQKELLQKHVEFLRPKETANYERSKAAALKVAEFYHPSQKSDKEKKGCPREATTNLSLLVIDLGACSSIVSTISCS